VVVFERSERACGASVRNFGMIWPIGQPAGPRRLLALRSREIWLDTLAEAGLWYEQVGSLHLAYYDDEAAVLAEFAGRAGSEGFGCELLGPAEVTRLAPLVRAEGLRAGLFSAVEICVDPREVVARLPRWLSETQGIRFEFGRAVVGYDWPCVRTHGSGGTLDFDADRLWVCAGDDFQSLYPEAFAPMGLVRCKLQMMRAEPLEGDARLGPMLAAGLTLRHYPSFEGCPSLPALRSRVARETPEFDRYGIHVLVSQNGRGEVVLGDSHEYGDAIELFDKAEIEDLILAYLATFLNVTPRITARWHGTYAKHPSEPYIVAEPGAGVVAVTAVGGAGMTLSFGLAEQVVNQVLRED
jgi:FAD dependent oxidoreductase TIGR03364